MRFYGNCSTIDLGCVCASGLTETDTFEWLLARCSFPDALRRFIQPTSTIIHVYPNQLSCLESQNLTSSTCGYQPRDKSSHYAIFLFTTNAVTKLIMIARLVHARFVSPRRCLGGDDYAALALLFLGITATVVNVRGLNAHGLGRDVWTLSLPEISQYGLYMYIMTIFYVVEMMLLKLAFCFLYLRIFPSVTLRRLLWGTVVFYVLFGMAVLVASVLMCVPVQYTWLKYVDPLMRGRCLDQSRLYWTYGAVTVAGDIWLLALPLRPVWKLNLHWKRKVGIAIMLMTGFV